MRVEVLGVEEGLLEITTKGLTSVTELGERLAEEMVTIFLPTPCFPPFSPPCLPPCLLPPCLPSQLAFQLA